MNGIDKDKKAESKKIKKKDISNKFANELKKNLSNSAKVAPKPVHKKNQSISTSDKQSVSFIKQSAEISQRKSVGGE